VGRVAASGATFEKIDTRTTGRSRLGPPIQACGAPPGSCGRRTSWARYALLTEAEEPPQQPVRSACCASATTRVCPTGEGKYEKLSKPLSSASLRSTLLARLNAPRPCRFGAAHDRAQGRGALRPGADDRSAMGRRPERSGVARDGATPRALAVGVVRELAGRARPVCDGGNRLGERHGEKRTAPFSRNWARPSTERDG